MCYTFLLFLWKMIMKIQVLSDLHSEFFNSNIAYLGFPQLSSDADVIVLVGDIHSGIAALEQAKQIASVSKKPVIFVPGNHEFYRQDIEQILTAYRQGAKGVHVLLGVAFDDLKEDETYVDIQGVRFLGGTFWTDFKLYEGSVRMPTQQIAMSYCEKGINDFTLIKKGSHIFTAQDSVDYFNQCYSIVNKVLELPFDGKKVLLSHHGLHKQSIHAKYSAEQRQLDSKYLLPNEKTGWMINPGFASHHPELLERLDLHIHGHTHSSLDYQVGKCRVVANPRGYPMNVGGKLAFENPDYQMIKLIEI